MGREAFVMLFRARVITAPLAFALASLVGAACSSSDAGPRASASASPEAGADPDGASPGEGGAPPGPVTPTTSSWLGTNVGGDLPFVDATAYLQPFDTGGGAKDANGYPAAGVNGTSSSDAGFLLPSGTYKITFKGTGNLAVSGIGKLAGSFTPVGGEQHADVTIQGTPGAFGNMLTLAITNGPGQTVTDVHLYLPGTDYGPTSPFTPQLLNVLRPFRALRFMDWMGTNGSTVASFGDRVSPTAFNAGSTYERIVELVNVTGKDAWINVPEHATDDYVKLLGTFLRDHLDTNKIAAARAAQGITTPFRVWVEYSNETWNGGFSARATLLAAAKKDPATYGVAYAGTYGPSWVTGDADLMSVGRYEGDRLAQIVQLLRQAYQGGDPFAGVLAGWALAPAYSDDALRMIKDKYGDPKALVSGIAIAPYFGPDDAATGQLADLFAATSANIDGMDAAFGDFAKLSAEYGIPIVAYEGGQGLTGTANQKMKHLAQHDRRMGDAYEQLFTLWNKHFGRSLFMHFSLAGTPGIPESIFQYGYWGSLAGLFEDTSTCGVAVPTLTGTENVADVVHHCPKYAALAAHVPE